MSFCPLSLCGRQQGPSAWVRGMEAKFGDWCAARGPHAAPLEDSVRQRLLRFRSSSEFPQLMTERFKDSVLTCVASINNAFPTIRVLF